MIEFGGRHNAYFVVFGGTGSCDDGNLQSRQWLQCLLPGLSGLLP